VRWKFLNDAIARKLEPMKELKTILKAWQEIKKTEDRAKRSALATVVEVRGSSYRRPGARMLLSYDGHRVGTISGGCLESDVWLRAQQVMDSDRPVLVTYDTTSPNDIIWGSGLGCRGIVRVLIEPSIAPRSATSHEHPLPDVLEFLTESLCSSSCSVLATIYTTEGTVAAKIGSRLMLPSNGFATTDIVDPELTRQIQADAREARSSGRSTNKLYQTRDGKAEVFIEVIAPPTPLVIFGAGSDTIPLVHFAHELGWQVTVVNTRPHLPLSHHFEEASAVIATEPESMVSCVPLNERTAVAIVTHNFLHDWELLKTLLPSPVRYIGLLGSRQRTEELLRVLPETSLTAGMVPTCEQLTRLHAPVGLDIGAETPEEIALSIIAEIKAFTSGRFGGSLRARNKHIHLENSDTIADKAKSYEN
jgi:xanthine dehydrogenase accessory factor